MGKFLTHKNIQHCHRLKITSELRFWRKENRYFKKLDELDPKKREIDFKCDTGGYKTCVFLFFMNRVVDTYPHLLIWV